MRTSRVPIPIESLRFCSVVEGMNDAAHSFASFSLEAEQCDQVGLYSLHIGSLESSRFGKLEKSYVVDLCVLGLAQALFFELQMCRAHPSCSRTSARPLQRMRSAATSVAPRDGDTFTVTLNATANATSTTAARRSAAAAIAAIVPTTVSAASDCSFYSPLL